VKTTYTFYEDSYHGYLEVTRQELIDLGIADRISECSFEKGDRVYLEEDADASLFVKVKGEDNLNITTVDQDGHSLIEKYNRYQI
jgi:hypothetical protein